MYHFNITDNEVTYELFIEADSYESALAPMNEWIDNKQMETGKPHYNITKGIRRYEENQVVIIRRN